MLWKVELVLVVVVVIDMVDSLYFGKVAPGARHYSEDVTLGAWTESGTHSSNESHMYLDKRTALLAA